MVKTIGDNISMSEYNGLVYLLRKFKKLVRYETISNVLETDVGTLNVTSGFINVGENFILENDVNIISQNCLPLTTYYFTFYIVNADTSETVLETPVTLSASTDKYGNLNLIIPENLLSDGEEIRRDIKIEITFKEHEGVSPSRLLNLDLTTDKKYISNGETATVTATLLDTDDEPLANYTVYFDVNGVEISRITNSDGEAVLTFTGTGDTGVLNIKVLDKEINIIDYYFYDHGTLTDHNSNYRLGKWDIYYRQNSCRLLIYERAESYFCPSTIPTETDMSQRLQFDTPYCIEFDVYRTTENMYLRVFDGNYAPYTVYLNHLIEEEGHYRLIVKEDIVELWVNDILIKEAVVVDGDTSVGFVNMKGNPLKVILDFANLIIYNYETYEPSNYSLSLSGNNIIQSGDSDTITATLTDNGVPVSGETLNYEIKKGSTVIDSGSSTTDSNGEIEIEYTGTGVGDVDVIVSFDTSLQKTFAIKDAKFYDASSSININNYNTTPGVSITYDSTNSAYLLSHDNSSSLTSIQLKDHTFTDTVTVEADIMLSSTVSNVQCGLGLLNGNISVNAKTTFYSPSSYYAISLIESTKTSYGSNEVASTSTSLDIQKNIWYRAVIVYNGSDVTFTLYNGNTIIGTVRATKPVLSTTSNELAFWLGFNNAQAYIKNIMVY